MTSDVSAPTGTRVKSVTNDKILARRIHVKRVDNADDKAMISSVPVLRIGKASFANWNVETFAPVVPARTAVHAGKALTVPRSSAFVVRAIVEISAKRWQILVDPIRVSMEDCV